MRGNDFDRPSFDKLGYFCRMELDYLLIGQGISGTWLSYYLEQSEKSFLVIDNNDRNAPSRLTAGIINPVTGRRHAQAWMADTVLPFAKQAYETIGRELNITAISEKPIIDFFPSPQMRLSFMDRVAENAAFVYAGPDHDHHDLFNYDFGCGVIQPVYTAHIETLLPAWRKRLSGNHCLLEETFDQSLLAFDNEGIRYKDIRAGKIIFCDGPVSAANPFFDKLPFAPNKGQALVLSIPALPKNNIYKKGMMLAPLATPDLWWIGSSYEWDFEHTDPTEVFKENTMALLNNWLKTPFEVIDHLSGLRPATLERRPFVGLHPVHASVGVLNGMGTKGASLAPFFAKQLSEHLVLGKPIHPEADLQRFRKILSRVG